MRPRVPGLAIVVALLVAACSAGPPPGPPAPPPLERVPLEPEISPVPFRWLSEDAVLVDPRVGERALAAFGNHVDRRARDVARARLAVWDDEAAWRGAREQPAAPTHSMSHKRAQYLKEPAPDAVEQFTVFDQEGRVVYERDFRDWPLSPGEE